MIVEDKKPVEGNEKEWEDPKDPNKPTDERDKEQLLRQYKEAKRRHDNLNDEDNQKDKTK